MKSKNSCPFCFQEFFHHAHLKTHLRAFHPVNDSALLAMKAQPHISPKKENLPNNEVKHVDSSAKDVISELIEVMGVDKVLELINMKAQPHKSHKKENPPNHEVNHMDSSAKDVLSEIIGVMGVDKVIELINTI